MMFLIFFPFIHSAKVRDSNEEYFNYYREKARKLPNFGILLDIPDISQEEIDRRQSAINNLRSCSMSDKYEGYDQNYLNQYTDICRIIVDAFQGLFISNGTNVNDVIAQVPSKTQLLFIGTSVNQKVNFSEFQSPVSVLCVDIKHIFPDFSFTQTSIRNSFNNLVKTVIKSSVDGTPKSFIDLFRNLKKDNKKTSSSDYQEIQIIGSMNEKVSYLYALFFNITFADEACNAQNLHLDYSVLSPSSKGIESEFLYLSSNTIELAESLAGKVNQTTIIHNDEYYRCYTLTIEYKKDSLSFAKSSCSYGSGTSFEIPYSSSTQSIGFIADYDYDEYDKPLTVYINYASNEGIENILNLNLSFGHNYNVNLYDFDEIGDFLPKRLEKSLSKRLKNSLPKVEFKDSGTWDKAETKRPQLTVVSDASVINVDTSQVADKFEVTREAPAVIEREGGGGDDDDDGLSAGAIAGIVIACVVVVAAIVAVIVYFVVFRKKRDSSQEADK